MTGHCTKCAETWPLGRLTFGEVVGDDHPPYPVVLCPNCHEGLSLEILFEADAAEA
jgi:hypothetical protein